MPLKIKTILRVACLAGALLFLPPASPVRADESGFYFGGSAAHIRSDCCAADAAFGGRGFAGYRINRHIGGEVGYAGVGDFNARTFSFTGIARVPADILGDIFVRAGVHSWRQSGLSGTHPVFGGGFELPLPGVDNVRLRSELIYYTGESYDFAAAGLGIVIQP